MKRILFVDDERASLDGLRIRLHHKRSVWEMIFALGGEEALGILETCAVDVIVTDLRMPGMDGADLLASVNERWPQTVRIVLSGFTQQQQTARVVRYAHQHLSKPCEPRALENVIERCLNLQALIHDPQLRAVVGRVDRLPTVPKVYGQLNEAMARPDVSAEDLAQIISRDIAITARVLQVVNSSFFRLARKINRIEHAVTYLGFATIRNLVISMEVFSGWPSDRAIDFDPQRLQSHGRYVAAGTRALTQGMPFSDDAILAGMLHDIGYLILAQQCPQEFLRALAESRSSGLPLHDIERRLIGASHAQVGAYLLGIWGLPFSVIEAVAHHHEPEGVAQTGFDVLGALVVAESMIEGAHVPAAHGLDSSCRAVNDQYLQALNAPFDLAEARRRVNEVFARLKEEELAP